jgi:hypothetical protein
MSPSFAPSSARGSVGIVAAAAPRSEYSVTAEIVEHLDENLLRDIDTLSSHAIEANVFLESWMLEPALQHLGVSAPRLIQIRHHTGELTGLFAVSLQGNYRGVPVATLRSWEHDYLYLSSPLIARHHLEGTLNGLLDWLASKQSSAPILEIVSMRADGPIAQALRHAVARRPQFAMYVELRERAMLDLTTGAGTGVSGKHRKELRRQERRLSELGPIEYRSLSKSDSADEWIERFLTLEEKGWKGKRGTAMAARVESRRFFFNVARSAHQRGQLQMRELTLNGEVIATKCNFTSGDGAFMFKIAFDESFARYSPGMLLELFNMNALESTPGDLNWVDSCAKSDHFMIERLWVHRRTLGNFSICARGWIAKPLIRYGATMRNLRHRARLFFGRTPT